MKYSSTVRTLINYIEVLVWMNMGEPQNLGSLLKWNYFVWSYCEGKSGICPHKIQYVALS